MKENRFNKSDFQEASADSFNRAALSEDSKSAGTIGLQGPVLLVESNRNDVLLDQRFFRRNKILNDLVVTPTGEEALQFLQTKDAPMPVLAMVGYRLTGMDGVELVRAIRKELGLLSLPIMLLASLTYDRDQTLSVADSATTCAMRPLELEPFADATRRLGIHWQLNLPSTKDLTKV